MLFVFGVQVSFSCGSAISLTEAGLILPVIVPTSLRAAPAHRHLLALLQVSLYCALSVSKINPTTLGIKFRSFSQDEQEKPECVPGVQKKVMHLSDVACSR